MTLEEIKTAIVEKIDTGWQALKDEVDPDAVRAYVQKLTTELYTHVLEVEAHLVNHVLGNGSAVDPEQQGEPQTATTKRGKAQKPPADARDETAQAAQ